MKNMKILPTDYLPKTINLFHKYLSKIVDITVYNHNKRKGGNTIKNQTRNRLSEMIIKNLSNYNSNDSSIKYRIEKTYTGKATFA
jgi:hypothetical protein